MFVASACLGCSLARDNFQVPDASFMDQRDELLGDGTVTVVCGGPASSQVLTGTTNFIARRYLIAAGVRPILMRPWHGAIGSHLGEPGEPQNGRQEFIAQPRLIDRAGHIMGGVGSIRIAPDGLNLEFRNSIRIEAGSSQPVDIMVDVSATEGRVHQFTQHWYDVSISDMGLTYADTGTPVPAHLIMMASNCTDTREASFFVRPRYADVSLTRAISVPFDIATPALSALSLALEVNNQGMAATELTGFEITAQITTDQGRPLLWAQVADECRLMADSTVVQALTPQTSALVHDISLSLRPLVATSLQLYCDYHWPPGVGAQTIQIALGIRPDSIRLSSMSAGVACVGNDLVSSPSGPVAQVILHR